MMKKIDIGRPEERRKSSADQLPWIPAKAGIQGRRGEEIPSRPSVDAGLRAAPVSPISNETGPVPSIRSADPAPSFIETQFPVSRLSKESYKERDAKNGQTLTGLGKWWGRKPLIVVRAVILGLLMPASEDPRKDRDAFLALLTMDEDGLWRRKARNIPLKDVYGFLSPTERRQWFADAADASRPGLKPGMNAADKERLQRIVFGRMGYDEKLKWCVRPEHLNGPSPEAWRSINQHLGTTAASLPELVRELGERRFGHAPRIGDAFCGGGSVPFEAARLGCEAYGSDLNPVAALLTWGALNIVGGGAKVAESVQQAQVEVFDAVDRQITEWRIEHNEVGWRADSFLYCTETTCPECGWRAPLAPSWVVGEKPLAIAQLQPQPKQRSFAIDIHSGVSRDDVAAAREAGTVKRSRLECPNPDCDGSTPITAIRRDQRGEPTSVEIGSSRRYGLRQWENDDLVPRPDDIFQERLYCVRWRPPSLDALLRAERVARSSPPEDDADGVTVPDWLDLDRAIAALVEFLDTDKQTEVADLRQHDRRAGDDARIQALAKSLPKTVYRSVDDADLEREAHALALLRERFAEWQTLGYIPSRAITPGYNTDQPIRERGWTHWHHLFTPRQLLTLGLIWSEACSRPLTKEATVALMLGLSRCADYNSKLCRWHTRTVGDKSEQTFSNQALNTMLNFAGRGVSALDKAFHFNLAAQPIVGYGTAMTEDTRALTIEQDVWLTDPPYADAINYHELSEYFLAWYGRQLLTLFPDWYADSKRALAVKGADADFRRHMVECYRNLADHMPENGLQVVMFTHQDASVWADPHPHSMGRGPARDRCVDHRDGDRIRSQGRQLCPGHRADGAAQADFQRDGVLGRVGPRSRDRSGATARLHAPTRRPRGPELLRRRLSARSLRRRIAGVDHVQID